MSQYTMLYKYGKRTRDSFGRFYCYFSLVFELFFCKKKYLLVGAWGMLWAGESVSGSVDQWISGSVDQ